MAMAKKISDEVREVCDICACHDELCALADRIDRELVELPRDRDGVPIHVGDTVWNVDNGIEFTATSITLYANGVTKVDASCEGCRAHTSPSDFTHTRPDSWERIAEELEEWKEDNRVNGNGEVFFRAGDLADRIRRLADKESQR